MLPICLSQSYRWQHEPGGRRSVTVNVFSEETISINARGGWIGALKGTRATAANVAFARTCPLPLEGRHHYRNTAAQDRVGFIKNVTLYVSMARRATWHLAFRVRIVVRLYIRVPTTYTLAALQTPNLKDHWARGDST
jgi:hypothetical protein